jgi:hypothetical protein
MESLSLMTVVTGVALAATAWTVTRWWYRRELSAWMRRMHKCEAKLDATAQQLRQTRNQIEKLQRELSEARRAAAVSQLGSQRARAALAAAPAAAAAAKAPAESVSKPPAAHGFADTQPL